MIRNKHIGKYFIVKNNIYKIEGINYEIGFYIINTKIDGILVYYTCEPKFFSAFEKTLLEETQLLKALYGT